MITVKRSVYTYQSHYQVHSLSSGHLIYSSQKRSFLASFIFIRSRRLARSQYNAASSVRFPEFQRPTAWRESLRGEISPSELEAQDESEIDERVAGRGGGEGRGRIKIEGFLCAPTLPADNETRRVYPSPPRRCERWMLFMQMQPRITSGGNRSGNYAEIGME